MSPVIGLPESATAMAAGGKVLIALQNNQPIPEGWVVDQHGKPTTNPSDFLTPDLQILGGMLPFGGHKGYALAMFAEVIGAILTGYGPAYRSDYIEGNGTFIIAIEITRFIEANEFSKEVDGLLSNVKAVQCDEHTSEILIPGEIEFRTRTQRERDGIPIPDGTSQTIADTAGDLACIAHGFGKRGLTLYPACLWYAV